MDVKDQNDTCAERNNSLNNQHTFMKARMTMQTTTSSTRLSSNCSVDGASVNLFDASIKDISTFEFFDVSLANSKSVPVPRTSAKDLRQKEIDAFVSAADVLADEHNKYHTDYIVRGNEALYALLAKIYALCIKIDASESKDAIIKALRISLEEKRDIKTQKNSTLVTMVTRYVAYVSRQVAHTYSRALDVAFKESLTPEQLPAYFVGRGGINKVRETVSEIQAAKTGKEQTEKKQKLVEKILLAYAKRPEFEIDWKKGIMKAQDAGTFTVIIAANTHGNHLSGVFACQLSKGIEGMLLSQLTESMPDDVAKIQARLDKLRADYGITSGYGMVPGDVGYVEGSRANAVADIRAKVGLPATTN